MHPLRRKTCSQCSTDLGKGKFGSWCVSEVDAYGRRRLFCIRCAKGPEPAELSPGMSPPPWEALSLTERVRRWQKRSALIDSLTMRYVCTVCERPYALLMRHWPREQNPDYQRFASVCSDGCAQALRRRRRMRLLPPRECPCGELFTSKRRDARYCSAACRQRAHRERQQQPAT